MSTVVKDLGAVSAYAYAVEKGYTGTEAEFAELMADYAEVGQRAEDAADSALESKTAAQTAATTATNKAGEATTAAQTATTKAGEASQSASTATSAKDTAVSASQTATSKATEAAQSATSANTAKVDAVTAKTAAETAQGKAEDAQAAAEEAAESVSASAAQIATNTSDISDLKEEFTAVNNAFDYERIALALSAFVSGKYMGMDGVLAEQAACQYATVEITSDLIYKTLLISGSAWWSVNPYVFIASDDAIEYADIPAPGGTLTQYTDLVFSAKKTGTLYINKYASGSVVHVAKADYLSLSSIKDAYLPNDIENNILDALSYKPINLTMIEGKLLSGSTGAITDYESTMYRVSDYVEVDGNSWYLVSTENFWSNGLYAWYDENKVFISGLSANAGGTITKFYCRKIKSPANARYLVIGFLYQANYTYPFLMAGEMKSILPSKRWSGKKWACVGDSLTEAYSRTGAHYFDIISAVTGIEAINMGVSGTGYARGTDNFMTRALTVPTDSDVVTFFGSGNDSGAGLELGTASDTGTETLGGCINTAIDNLYSIMPVVQLGIVTPTPWQGNMPSDNGWMARYSALIVEICNRRSIPCLDLFHCSNLNPNSAEVRQIAYVRDNGGGVHPSEAGHAIIAPRIQSFLDSLLMH